MKALANRSASSVAAIQAELDRRCQFGDGCPDRLRQAIRYAVLAPGKRLRPRLVCMAADVGLQRSGRSVDWSAEDLLDVSVAPTAGIARWILGAAAAIEMIHAYSLIHDDLPAMDDDDLRRGRPTVHVQFDPATAILAGDALQPAAFATLADAIDDAAVLSRCVTELAVAAGPCSLVGGQADDLSAETTDASKFTAQQNIERLESIHRRKTGALFIASVRLGCIVSGASDDTTEHLTRYATHLGLGFQVMDDYLDATSDAAVLGKRVGKDIDRGKLTYVAQWGVEGTLRQARHLIEQSIEALNRIDGDTEALREVANFVTTRKH